jgi:hypothetical protein
MTRSSHWLTTELRKPGPARRCDKATSCALNPSLAIRIASIMRSPPRFARLSSRAVATLWHFVLSSRISVMRLLSPLSAEITFYTQ